MLRFALSQLFAFLLIFSCYAGPHDGNATEAPLNSPSTPPIPLGKIDPELLPIGYPQREVLSYDVSWSGGIKIGELHLTLQAIDHRRAVHEIRAEVTTQDGAIDFIYPIRDVHVTLLEGLKKLPYHAEIWQNEGYSYKAHREFEFNQTEGIVRYLKNGKLEGVFEIAGETNNEFSSFFNSRLMNFTEGSKFIVPTFADKKRVEVVVNVMERQTLRETILGPVETMKIMPVMTFKGLYDKKGDTVIWYTDDECRVPVRIESKILIGALTAELKAYDNPACPKYNQISMFENN